MGRSRKVAIKNLGCKVNEYETEVLIQMLKESGYIVVGFEEVADIYIVNTCSVTNMADRKSRQLLHKAKKINKDSLVIAMGCYVQANEEAAKLDDSIDIIIGNNKKKEIIEIIDRAFEDRFANDKTLNNTTIIDISREKNYEEMKRNTTVSRTRANVKIQDGCNQFCTFCIIPYARGRVRSRKLEDIIAEVEGLVDNGYKEVVLTGIHISSYGIDLDKDIRLIDVLREINKIKGVKRIRIGSLEPRIITEKFATELVKLEKICPHFHLSLQSGSDSVLKRMNRRYTSGEYFEKVKMLRKYYDKPAITTDIIVGFPEETKEEHIETVEFVKKIKFAEAHIFKYSKRHGTVAAMMEGQVDEAQKNTRSNELITLASLHAKEYKESYLDTDVEVLFEERKTIDDIIFQVGHTREYIKVAIKSDVLIENQIKDMKIAEEISEGYMEVVRIG